ncbi:MAG: hypothetical protein MUE73_22160 [Planctomycetes bacterium]|jgi:hypothetical protein|nr:hypothetical protein [Planctomycetota bacterium]
MEHEPGEDDPSPGAREGSADPLRDLAADDPEIRLLRQGRLSLGGLARRLDVPLAEAMDLLAELGIRAPIEYDDYLKAPATAASLLRDPDA